MDNDILKIGGREFGSRLILGTGKFASLETMKTALAASGAAMATVALKRVDLSGGSTMEDIADFLERDKYMVLPNTSGALSADEAVRIARLGRAAGFGDFIKLELKKEMDWNKSNKIE